MKIIIRSAAALACFFALLLTGSRGGLICASLGLLVAISLMAANRWKQRFWRVALFSGLALAILVVLLGRIGRIGSQGLFDDGRWSVYGFCLEAIRQRPLLGAGVGTFADLFPSLRSADFYSWGVWESAHSTILEIAVEMGLPVAAAILIAALASLFILARATIKSEGRSRRLLAAITGIAFDNRLFLADSWLSCLVWNSDWLRPGAVALHLAGGRHCASAPAGMSSVKQLPWVWVDWT